MKRGVFFGISLLVGLVCNAQEALNQLVNNACTQNANSSIYIKNITTGKVLSAYRAEALVPPASTMKLLTTASALELLGSNFQFSTFLETNGKIENRVLRGNLYIRGTGDPTLGSSKVGDPTFLYKWAQALRRLGIDSIAGDIVADASFFDADAVNPQWIWEDIGNYYAAGVYALPYLDNTLNIQLRSSAVGSVAEVIKTIPSIEGLTFENHIRCTTAEYDGAYVHGAPYSNSRYLVGSVPANRGVFGVRGDIPNPPLLLAQHLKKRLQEAHIGVSGKATYLTESLRPNRQILYEHRSEPLSEIVKETNIHSNNLYAEQLFRYLGSRMAVPCTISRSVEVEKNCWINRGINLQNTFVMDGCGLAPQDAISAKTFVDILAYMYQSPQKEPFLASLPIAGKTGTLRSFLLQTPLEGHLMAKSGTTSRIKSYAGYFTLPNGNVVAFAIIMNNAACKPKSVQHMIEKYLVHVYQTNR